MTSPLRLIVSFASVDKLSGPLKNIVGLAQTGSERFAGMKRAARDLDRELRGVQGELARSSGNVTELMEREASLKAQIAETNREMEKQARILKLQASADKMIARGESLKASGQQHMIAGAAMAAPLIYAGKAAMDYEKKLALIAQKSDLSAAATQAFGDRVLKVAADTSQGSSTLLEAVDFLGGKGVAVDAIDAMLPAIGKFATAWDANVVDASKAAYAGFLSLKVPLSDTARSLEIMAAAGNAGGFEVKDMAQYFPQLTANMATFGASGVTAVADLSAALQVLEAKSGDGAAAATNLGNLLTFAKTSRGIKNFQKFGVDVTAALKKAEQEGASPIQTLIDLINEATKGDTSKIPQLISDQQAGKGALALIDSAQRYQEIKAEALAAVGLTEKEFNRMAGTSAANFQNMQTALQTLTLTAGTHLLPALTDGVKWITRTVGAISAWARANPGTTKTLLQIVGALAVFRIGLGAFQFVFGSSLVMMGKGFGLLISAGPTVVKTLGMIRTGALFLARGVIQAGMMMLANPLVAVIVGIVAVLGVAGYMIYKHWDTIMAAVGKGVDWVQGKWASFQTWLGGAVTWFVNLHARFNEAGQRIMQGLWEGISSRVAAIKNLITGIAGSVVGWFKNILGIKSPSRVFMGLGGQLGAGLALGIAQSQGAAAMATRSLADEVIAAPRLELPAPAAGAGRSARFGDVNITIKAAPGQSPQDIAEEVKRILDELSRRGGGGSSFTDDED